VTHALIAGPRLSSKHAVLAHLIGHATESAKVGGWAAASSAHWSLGEKEYRLARTVLPRALREQTASLECPGENYTLARTFLLARHGRLCAMHNLAELWTSDERRLYQNGYPLVVARVWFVVLDAQQLEQEPSEGLGSPAEVLSRMVRVVQQLQSLSPTDVLSPKLAVLLPIPHGHAVWRTIANNRSEPLSDRTIRGYLLQRAPVFCGLARTMFESQRVRYFGGLVPDSLNLKETPWAAQAWKWGTE
jgi:hypothetical protein